MFRAYTESFYPLLWKKKEKKIMTWCFPFYTWYQYCDCVHIRVNLPPASTFPHILHTDLLLAGPGQRLLLASQGFNHVIWSPIKEVRLAPPPPPWYSKRMITITNPSNRPGINAYCNGQEARWRSGVWPCVNPCLDLVVLAESNQGSPFSNMSSCVLNNDTFFIPVRGKFRC